MCIADTEQRFLAASIFEETVQKFFAACAIVPCALYLDGLTAQQRRNLVESRIPFIAEPQQVYLPFWGCFFS